jgi:predicted nucleic acid-binding protein
VNVYLDSTSLLDFATMGSSWRHAELLKLPATKIFSSNLALAEIKAALTVADIDPHSVEELMTRVYRIWSTMHRIPIDDLCLRKASELTSQYFVSLTDAIHLASMKRVPNPRRFLTLNQSQVLVAHILDDENRPT